MKTKLIAILLIATLFSASGQDWVGDPPDWLTHPTHNKHSVTITVTYNGRTVTRTIAAGETLDERNDLIIATALEAFNATKVLDQNLPEPASDTPAPTPEAVD